MNAPAVITIDNLHFAYENSTVLEADTVRVAQGDFIGLFGPNGGGKTTLLKLLMGFLTPTRGEIRIKKQKQRMRIKNLVVVSLFY